MTPLRIIALALVVAAAGTAASAQSSPALAPGPVSGAGQTAAAPAPTHQPMDMRHMAAMHGQAAAAQAAAPQAALPTEPGQAAFGAIQEIVRMLQADPHTDWSKVDIDALRQHLIDMQEVTIRATARKQPIDNGLRIRVTGDGRTREAIQRMIPAHVADINGLYGWTVQAKAIPNGEEMTVTAHNPADVRKIRGLGFMGIMVLGTHQMHHLAMAKGEPMEMPGVH